MDILEHFVLLENLDFQMNEAFQSFLLFIQ